MIFRTKVEGSFFWELSLGGFSRVSDVLGFFMNSGVPEKGNLGGVTDSCLILVIGGSRDLFCAFVLVPGLVVGMVLI